MGFVVSAFMGVLLVWICGQNHERLIWRLVLGLPFRGQSGRWFQVLGLPFWEQKGDGLRCGALGLRGGWTDGCR